MIRVRTVIRRQKVSGKDGMLVYNGAKEFELGIGVYHLVETDAPEGYILKEEPVVITVTESGVTYEEGTTLSRDGGITIEKKVYVLKVSNTSGYALPASGGPGTALFYMLGAVMVLGAGVLLAVMRKVRE